MSRFTSENIWGHSQLVAGLTIFTMVAFLVITGARIFARARLMGTGFLMDDALIIVAVIFAVIFCVLNLMIISLHKKQVLLQDRMAIDDIREFRILTFSIGPLSILCNGFTELSILSLYHRLSAPGTSFRRWTIFVAIFCALRTAATALAIFLQCNPIQKAWSVNPAAERGNCIDMQSLLKALTLLHTGSVWIVYILPIKHIWSLQMSLRKKWMVTGVFALGLVTCITSLVRVIKVWKSFEMDGGVQGAGAAEALVDDLILTVVEIGTGLICASLPALRVYFRLLGPRFRSLHEQTPPGGVSSSKFPTGSTSGGQSRTSRVSPGGFHHGRRKGSLSSGSPIMMGTWREIEEEESGLGVMGNSKGILVEREVEVEVATKEESGVLTGDEYGVDELGVRKMESVKIRGGGGRERDNGGGV